MTTPARAGRRPAKPDHRPDGPRGATAESESRLRGEVSDLRGLLALSLLMTARRREEEIAHVAVTALPALVAVRALGVHLVDGERTTWLATGGGCATAGGRSEAARQIRSLPADDGPLDLAGEPWCWAFPLRSLGELMGHLLVGADEEPDAAGLLLIRSLAQQAGISLANARLHARNVEANEQLASTVRALRHKTAIHDRLTQASLGDEGVQGVVDALHELTGLTAVVETRAGDVLAWAGPEDPPVWKGSSERHEQVLRRALRAGHPIHADGRLLVLARPREDVVGVLSLIDPERAAGDQEVVALEHASVVLAIELSRQHSLAETELRLGRDLLADLLTGSGEEAYQRARALGHDLRRPHRVVVVTPGRRATADDPLLLRTRDAMASLLRGAGEPPVLLVQKDATVVAVVTESTLEASGALESLAQQLGPESRIGVGGLCSAREEYPRSFREAGQALRLTHHLVRGRTVLRYDDMGVFRLLSENADPDGLDAFARRWLGPLLDYDAAHRSELVRTLSHHLDCGGSYDATATALMIGRTTVRYRVRRIQQLTGHDLSDPETRFQLHLAVKAFATRSALAPG